MSPGRYRAWAVAGAFGDNLAEPALAGAAAMGLDAHAVAHCAGWGSASTTTRMAMGRRTACFRRHFTTACSPSRIRWPSPNAMPRKQRLDVAPRRPRRALAIRPAVTRAAATADLPARCTVESPGRRNVRESPGHRATRSHHGGAYALARGLQVSLRAPRAHGRRWSIARQFVGGGRAAASGIDGLPESEVPRLLAGNPRAASTSA